MTLRVLGVDPGPALTGLALLEFDALDPRPQLIEGDHVKSFPAFIERWVIGHGVDVVAIEQPEGFGNIRFNPQPVIDTARIAGGIEWLALAKGIDVVCLTARAWRGELCRKPSASDAMVTAAVVDLIREMASGNTHVRDAAGAAAVVGFRALGRRPALSMRAEHKLLELGAAQREKANAKRAAKRQRIRAHLVG